MIHIKYTGAYVECEKMGSFLNQSPIKEGSLLVSPTYGHDRYIKLQSNKARVLVWCYRDLLASIYHLRMFPK